MHLEFAKTECAMFVEQAATFSMALELCVYTYIYIVEKVDKFTNNTLFDLEGRCNGIVSGKMHLLVIVFLISSKNSVQGGWYAESAGATNVYACLVTAHSHGVPSPTHFSNSQHGGKVPSFEPHKAIKVGSCSFYAKIFTGLVGLTFCST